MLIESEESENIMTRTATKLVLTALILTGFLMVGSSARADSRLGPAFRQAGESLESDSLVNIIVFLDNGVERAGVALTSDNPYLSRSERIREVYRKLHATPSREAGAVEQFLSDVAHGEITRFWIVPAYAATVPMNTVQAIAELPGVDLVIPDADLTFDEPIDVKAAPSSAATVYNQLVMMDIPTVWKRGLTGSGRLVCSFDTGVDETHPALAGKWRGNHTDLSSSWFSTINPDTVPYDAAGHGTHTMGIMVGSNGVDSFGVAPGAEWITAGVIDQGKNLSSTISDILGAFQWALDPDGDPNTTDDVPDVVLNSWGIPNGVFDDCDDTFWAAIDNLEAAGIVTIFAAGNEGPDPKTIRTPADRSTTPLNSFCVGAVDNGKVIASFSSRGPSSCDTTQIKPEVVAPGVSIWSSARGGGYAYMSGTSMAAPFIAGLVALCRQYNPDATVEQIKNAIIAGAEDLGPVGEDNAYGHGFVNAARVIDNLPVRLAPEFSVASISVNGGGVALPGKQSDLYLELNNPSGNVEQVAGYLESAAPDEAVVIQDVALFPFGAGGTAASGYTPYQVAIDSSVAHGSSVPFRLIVKRLEGEVIDTVNFSVPVGYSPPGVIATHESGGDAFSISDFGQYGLGPMSIYNAGGTGFTYKSSSNLLYEAGLMVTAPGYSVSNSVRGSMGDFRVSDFTPIQGLGDGWDSEDGGYHMTAAFTDTRSINPLPVTVLQETVDYGRDGDDGMYILRYFLVTSSFQALDSVSFGLLADFDITGGVERVVYDSDHKLVYQSGDTGPIVGVVMLDGLQAVSVMANNDGKSGLTENDKYGLVKNSSAGVDESATGDVLFTINSSVFSITRSDTVTLACAMIAADNLDQLYASADRARDHYENLAAGRNPYQVVPESFVLEQNYPNPFNPTTSIAFELPADGDVSLEVFNTLGRRVRVLHAGYLSAGRHVVEWDGLNEGHRRVASGVYFYRLSTSEFSESRKMVLLK